MLDEFGNQGTQVPSSTSGQFNALTFIITQLLNKVSVCIPVKVISCTNNGGLTEVGFVDVQPLITQLDGFGNVVPHGIIHNVPYARWQGGGNAVIIDPEQNDLGFAVFSDKDISTFKETKDESPPGSFRRFSMADALYIGGVLNKVPTQYVQFNSAGIKVHSPVAIVLDAPDIQLDASTIEMNASTSITATSPVVAINAATSTTITTPTFTVNGATVLNGSLTQGHGTAGGASSMLGPLTVTNDVTASGTSVHTHTHSDPQGGNTGPPN